MLIVIICIYIFHCQPWPIFNCCSFHFLHSTARTKSGRSSATVADQSNGIRHQAAHQNGQKDKCIQKLLPKWSGGFVEGRLHRNDDLAFDSAIRYRSFDMAYTTITRAYHYRSNGCLEIGQQLCAWRIRIVHTQFRRKTTKGRKRDTDNERYRIVFPQSTDDHTFGCVEIRAGNFRMIVFVVYYWSLLSNRYIGLTFQNSYYYLLRRYLESIYPGCEAKSLYLRMIHKINELKQLKEVIITVYLDANPSQVEPLLREIFDLKNY